MPVWSISRETRLAYVGNAWERSRLITAGGEIQSLAWPRRQPGLQCLYLLGRYCYMLVMSLCLLSIAALLAGSNE